MHYTPEVSNLSLLGFTFQGQKEYALVRRKTRKGVDTFHIELFNIELYILFMVPLVLKEDKTPAYRNKEAAAIAMAVRSALFSRNPQASNT
jgi:hypothetical protein